MTTSRYNQKLLAKTFGIRVRTDYGADMVYVNAIRDACSTFPKLNCVFNEASDPSSFYCGSSVTTCMPLLPEGFGIVALESLVYGTPVMVNPVGGLSWTAGMPGVRIGDLLDALKTCALLREMLLNRKLLREEIAQARAALERRFSPQVMLARYLAVFEHALRQKHG